MNNATVVRRPDKKVEDGRIMQGDIFHNIDIVEDVIVKPDGAILLKKITFPLVICLNQDCDLHTDFIHRTENKSGSLLHLIVAPLFEISSFREGKNWGDLMNVGDRINSERIRYIKANNDPRYHYVVFPEKDMPELIIDFKYFFTINRDTLYSRLDHKVCSVDDLFRDLINQRFCDYLSRIGLPEIEVEKKEL
ncbi:hypothetical protein SAMN04487902_101335 [Prevotella sp. ne3005]|uniref:hypothetical protein n=1 Tax=Prevotella sp. ne3005 TaxID=1761887 RepID=UPI0008D3C2DE|nr:hypothetical protein [Prevotella sp. ne3005]SEM53234.1 hypothetical protein SAMN04487902_101335 [Prevotella sp. ne3005]